MAAKPVTRAVAFKPSFLELFDLVAADWRAPETMTITTNARRNRMTVAATFTRPDGVPVRLTSRMRQDADGAWWNVAETLRVRMTFKPAAAPAEEAA